jgi:hypothetical protein
MKVLPRLVSIDLNGSSDGEGLDSSPLLRSSAKETIGKEINVPLMAI